MRSWIAFLFALGLAALAAAERIRPHFVDVAPKSSITYHSVTTYDNDGYPGLFIANTGRNRNNRDGTFSDVTEAAGLGEGSKPARTLSLQAAFLDYDNDGRLDLVVSNYTLWTPESDIRCEKGGVDYYCHPKLYASSPPALPQPGQRQVRGCD